MGPADTDTDICSWPIFLPIPIPIYLDTDIFIRFIDELPETKVFSSDQN